MRVGIFTNTYHPTVNGVANCVAAYREGLTDRGAEVTVFAPAPPKYDRSNDPDNVLRFPTLPVPMDLDYSIAMPYSGSVLKALQRMQFDIIHTQHPVWVGAWGAWYARWNDTPLVTTVHTEYELFAPMVPLPTPLVEMYLGVRVTSYCNKCQMVTTAVESTRRRLIEQGITTPVEILPNPIRVAEFAQVDSTAVRRRLGLDDDTVLIGFVGRLSPEKNLDVLLQAVSTVLRQAPNTTFVVVGDGPEMASAKRRVAHLSAAERVFFVGAVPYPQIPPYQAAIDIMVTASLAVVATFRWFNEYCDERAPQILGGYKLGQAGGIERKQLRAAFIVAIVVSIVWCAWTHLDIFYRHGAAMATTGDWYTLEGGQWLWNRLQTWLEFPEGPDLWEIGGYLSGGAAALLLTKIRWASATWPLHPLGYALAFTNSTEFTWLPFLIGWLIKSTILRYGGFKVYRRVVPFFIGLIIGDLVTGGLWGLYGVIIGERMYMFFPH